VRILGFVYDRHPKVLSGIRTADRPLTPDSPPDTARPRSTIPAS
jgi:hypothetical protein